MFVKRTLKICEKISKVIKMNFMYLFKKTIIIV